MLLIIITFLRERLCFFSLMPLFFMISPLPFDATLSPLSSLFADFRHAASSDFDFFFFFFRRSFLPMLPRFTSTDGAPLFSRHLLYHIILPPAAPARKHYA